jgi:hypothetical protein
MLATVGHVNFLMKSINQWSLSMLQPLAQLFLLVKRIFGHYICVFYQFSLNVKNMVIVHDGVVISNLAPDCRLFIFRFVSPGSQDESKLVLSHPSPVYLF